MAKPSHVKKSLSKKDSRDIKTEAAKLVADYKVDGQTKEHTKLIANGVARGMEKFLRQQSEKSRDLDKRLKKLKSSESKLADSVVPESTSTPSQSSKCAVYLPWTLLLVSWAGMAIYAFTAMQ